MLAMNVLANNTLEPLKRLLLTKGYVVAFDDRYFSHWLVFPKNTGSNDKI